MKMNKRTVTASSLLLPRTTKVLLSVVLLLLLHSDNATSAFTSTSSSSSLSKSKSSRRGVVQQPFVVLQSSITPQEKEKEKSAVLTDEEVNPLIRLQKGSKEKVINAFGAWCAVVSVLTAPPWTLAMTIVNTLATAFENFDPNRALYDATGKIWSKVFLSMIFSYPEITGDVEGLKERKGACLYVANHASWLDIPVLCTVLDPVFKFISKAELIGVPCIGQQLTGGKHILIDRDDRRSQLRTFKEGVTYLKSGIPLMAFPEGKRSEDGKLMNFKNGMFSMAVKTGVPIVPITVSNTHAVMPSNALFPVQRGDGGILRVHVHEPIYPEGKKDTEIAEEVRVALISKLPEDQKPVMVVLEEEEVNEVVVDKILSEEEEKSSSKKEDAKVATP